MPIDRNTYQKIVYSFAKGEGAIFPLLGTVSLAGKTLRLDASTTRGGTPNVTGISALMDGVDNTKVNITVLGSATGSLTPPVNSGPAIGPETLVYIYCTLWDDTNYPNPIVLSRFALGVYAGENSR